MIDTTIKPNVTALIKVHWRPNSLIPKYEINYKVAWNLL